MWQLWAKNGVYRKWVTNKKSLKSGYFYANCCLNRSFGPITPLKLTYTLKTDVPQISQSLQNWTLPFDTENDKNDQFLLIVS